MTFYQLKHIVSIGLSIMISVWTQQVSAKTIKGSVLDENGEALIGASVSIDGPNKKTLVTDVDGNYAVDVDGAKHIKVSYVGYEDALHSILPTDEIVNFQLKPSTSSLDEVVVVGYGTSKRSELTGAISSVKGDAIRDYSTTSVADALAGMAAGVSVTSSTGNPGESPDIIIRGAASVNGMAPLYIVDGVKQSTGFSFNTNDIESIEVLKDAGSCAIYGAEAAGGVILVTTRRGAEGKAKLSLNARYGIRKQSSGIKLLNRDQFIAVKSIMGTDILAQEGVDSAGELPDVDWMDAMYDTGHEQEYNLSLSGGRNGLNYYLSAGFYDEKGVYLDSSADRFSVRTNVDWKINKIFTIGTSSYANYIKSNPTKVYSQYTNAVPFRSVPTMAPVDEDGNFASTPFYLNGPNLYGNELTYHKKGDDYGFDLLAYLDVRFIPELTLHVNGAAKIATSTSRIFSEAYNFRAVQESAYLESRAGNSRELTYNATLTFEKLWNEKWYLKAMIGSEATAYDSYYNYIRAIDFPVDKAWSVNLSSNTSKDGSDSPGVGRAMSFFGRINFNFDSRYYLTFNLRRDGSDRFGKNNRWGTFPSINVMWRASQEKFLEDLSWLSDAKIRTSYGILGNDGIAQFLFNRSYIGDQIMYNFGGNNEVSGWANFKVPNEDIKWEEVHQFDLGVDLAFLNNRLQFSYDFYNRQTHDMLYWKVVPLASGINWYYDGSTNTMPINIGRVSNIGNEFTLSWRDQAGDFSYSVGLNVSFNKNEIKELGTEGAAPLMSPDGINRTENGRSMSELWGYKCIGIFQDQAQVDEYNAKAKAAGHPYYWRQNTGVGDLIFDDMGQGYVNEDCKQYIGNPWPKATWGLNLSANWKGFDLAATFQAATGFDIYNAVKGYTQTFGTDGNTTMDIYKNSFFGGNGLTDQPRCGFIDESGAWIGDPSANFGTVNSFWVEKGDYLKLKNLVFGYSVPLPASWNKVVSKIRVYFSAQNLFTLTKYSGIDPEIAGTSTYNSNTAGTSMTARGVDTYNRYVPSRLYSFGLELGF